MYIGSVEPRASTCWVPREKATTVGEGEAAAVCRMEEKELRPVPGLVKLLDELLVNAMDNHQRDRRGTTRIDVSIDERAGVITVTNTGRPVPAQLHRSEGVWVPELVFGHLLTGSNFASGASAAGSEGGAGAGSAESDGAVGVGGRHGYGAKLANIFAKRFEVTVGDAAAGRLYRQRWEANMGTVFAPETAPFPARGADGPQWQAVDATAGEAGWAGPADASVPWLLPPSADALAGAGGLQSFTSVSFQVDLARFGRREGQGIDRASASQMRRRVWDAAGLLGQPGDEKAPSGSAARKGVAVTLNGRLLSVGGFPGYCSLFPPAAGREALLEEAGLAPGLVAHAKCGPRWEVGVGLASADSGRGGEAVSFVNGVFTAGGGAHVDVVTDELARRLAERIAPRVKAALAKDTSADASSAPAVTAASVRPHLRVFVSCRVAEPAFDSQTKERLTCAPAALGSLPAIPDRLVREAAATGIEAAVVAAALSRQQADTARAVRKLRVASKQAAGAGARARQVVDVPKLEDASLAGTARAEECTLILTEGDSAKALAVAGLAVVGRQTFGVFPLRGKLLNVRDLPLKAALENQEIRGIVTAMGLEPGRAYAGGLAEARSLLRYGRVMIMADQDNDGSHIKGLVLNMIHTLWPALLRGDGSAGDAGAASFVEAFITPVIKARRGSSEVRDFFSERAYQEWSDALPAAERARWSIKYYKGLGTSTAAEGRQYFSDLPRHRVPIVWGGDGDGDRVDMAFAKSRADDRKAWLLAAPAEVRSRVALCHQAGLPQAPGDSPPASEPRAPEQRRGEGAVSAPLPVSTFIDEELIEFSWADVHRSIPSVVDGLKPSQRKVLFACLARARKGGVSTGEGGAEYKVAQLAGAVAEATAYHHGEASLISTIVNMAQDYVGANNLPLLEPRGQFGTRLAGGKDAASARYIFTRLSPATRRLFPAVDDTLLPRCEDDGAKVEPVAYAPVIPLALVNGAAGIGTGWSTHVPMHGPGDVLAAVRGALERAPADLLALAGAHGVPSAEQAGAPAAADWAQAVRWDDGAARRWEELARDATAALFPGQQWAQDGHLLPWARGFAGGVKLVEAASSPAVETVGLADVFDYDAYAHEARAPSSKRTAEARRRAAARAAATAAGAAQGSAEQDAIAALAACDAAAEEAAAQGRPLAVRVRELPVGRWGEVFKRTLASLVERGLADDVIEASTDTRVDVTVALTPQGAAEAARHGVSRLLRLHSSEGLGNMHLFDPCGRIRRYPSASAVIGDFMPVRLALYARRRAAEEARLAAEREAAETRARFIEDVVRGRIDLAGRSGADVEAALSAMGYAPSSHAGAPGLGRGAAGDSGSSHHPDDADNDGGSSGAFEHLLRLPIRELTSENVAKNHARAARATASLESIHNSTPAGLWAADLDALEAALEPVAGHWRR
ncbi:hypothetical protein FNF31_06864 [Cafeteria roenbergensis]|uniref:DNA topoisomerase 2 n=1 Tax=Cafeteria roenbergensis TaxID=33653 RepID=A0A5A8CEI8_CAFRO|nr:hypothetical protein FNF31_06864 [Cafeteria roenbergensis]KAA0165832.1 hypothetical protein FNF28_03338 [Cafeteria roenbergensis]